LIDEFDVTRHRTAAVSGRASLFYLLNNRAGRVFAKADTAFSAYLNLQDRLADCPWMMMSRSRSYCSDASGGIFSVLISPEPSFPRSCGRERNETRVAVRMRKGVASYQHKLKPFCHRP